MRLRRLAKILAVVLAVVLLASACGDDSSSGTESGQPGGNGPTTTKEPQTGGIATIGQFTPGPGLDPVKIAGSGSVGGNELLALYDVLVRYNPETQKYEGRTAESLTATNADFTKWTLKLRPGIKFTDGTDYNADAVKWVFDRQSKEGNSNPRGQFNQFVKSVTVVDPLTLEFELKTGWVGFPYVLSGPNGMIYSKAAFEKAGGADKFNVAPGDAGAGPYKLKSYKPGEALELEHNPSYYGGATYLDGMKFIYVGGPQQSYEAIKSGTLTAAWVNSPQVVDKAKAEGFGTNITDTIAGNQLLMNSGIEVDCKGGQPAPICTGKADGEKAKTKTATSDVRVRQAVAHAVDPKVINQRVYEGTAHPDSAPYANSPWDPKIEGRKADPEAAKKLVADAKAAGWDGKIRVMASNTSEGINWAEAVRAQLVAVGMDVQVDTTKDTANVVNQVLVLRDFDIATWSLSLLSDVDSSYTQLLASLSTTGGKRYGYSSPEMDAAIEMLRTADTDQKRVDAYKKVSEVWVRDQPTHVTTMLPQGLVMSPKLHGVDRTAYTGFLFSKAWLEK
jgi:peptide/nickel transport system substrate-binding protein